MPLECLRALQSTTGVNNNKKARRQQRKTGRESVAQGEATQQGVSCFDGRHYYYWTRLATKDSSSCFLGGDRVRTIMRRVTTTNKRWRWRHVRFVISSIAPKQNKSSKHTQQMMESSSPSPKHLHTLVGIQACNKGLQRCIIIKNAESINPYTDRRKEMRPLPSFLGHYCCGLLKAKACWLTSTLLRLRTHIFSWLQTYGKWRVNYLLLTGLWCSAGRCVVAGGWNGESWKKKSADQYQHPTPQFVMVCGLYVSPNLDRWLVDGRVPQGLFSSVICASCNFVIIF